ncbi:MAG: HD domain-containing protein [Clostridia bacterium]|nr:HD domain-containing protein [Clostridia bacterium]
MNEVLEKARVNMLSREIILSKYACKSYNADSIKKTKEEIRPIFFRDIDRIIHSLAYTRYIDKTQVYSFTKNDHITHRVLHVQLVSKIARTIGRSLRLNEDLIEAIALGHDVGHTPFGHKGEKYLNDICKKENIGYFCHNAQSVRVLKDLEKVNISVQTLDGILSHNGEILINKYKYNNKKTKLDFETDLYNAFNKEDYSKKIVPMTLEASVVRLSDVIAYIGRDIEDSIKIETIKRTDIPRRVTKVLGDTNSQMVDTLIKDIIINSFEKPYLAFSDKIFEALMKLQDWNYKYIYASAEANKHQQLVEELFYELYECYLKKVEQYDENKKLTQSEKNLYEFIKDKEDLTNIKRTIVDYIAGQTDQYFLKECVENVRKFNIEELYK